MSQRYSEHYSQICEQIEALAAQRLGRPLTPQERPGIWEAGTLTWLEMNVEMPLHRAEGPDEVARLLARAVDELDGRRDEMIDSLAQMLVILLKRELSTAERQQLNRLPTVVTVMQLGEEVTIAVPEVRETVFHELLADL
jgi:hypothetical protein